MRQTITYAPPHSIFLFEDSGGALPPDIDSRALAIWWSFTSLVVGTLAFMDGDTTLTVSNSESDVPKGPPAADVAIACPSGELRVITSGLDVLMRIESPSNPARLAIWTNHPTEPDEIFVLVR